MQLTSKVAAMAAKAASRKVKISGAVAAGAVAVSLAAGGGAVAATGTPVVGTAATTRYTSQTINTGVATTVVSGASVPLTGLYYTSASLTISLPANTIVACGVFANGSESGSDVHIAGPYTKDSWTTIALTGYANFTAGDQLTVQCLDYTGPVSTFLSGTLSAVWALAATSGSAAATSPAKAAGMSPAAQLQRPVTLMGTAHSR